MGAANDVIDSAIGGLPEPSLVEQPTAEAFNPSIHETTPEGGPVFNADGKSLRRKRGRKAGVNYNDLDPIEAEKEAERKARVAAAEMYASLFFGAMQTLIDREEWEPESGELERLQGAIERYFEASGTIELPPGLNLCFVLGLSVMARLPKEKTQRKAGALIGAVTSKFRKKKPEPGQNEPRLAV